MTKWEYKLVQQRGFGADSTLEQAFNELGKDGWELAGIDWCQLIFKRDISPPLESTTLKLP